MHVVNFSLQTVKFHILVTGPMVPEFLTGNSSCEEYIRQIAVESSAYNAFHLVLMDLRYGDFILQCFTFVGKTCLCVHA